MRVHSLGHAKRAFRTLQGRVTGVGAARQRPIEALRYPWTGSASASTCGERQSIRMRGASPR